VTAFAQQLFKAKSKQLLTLSTHALVRGDLKVFEFKHPNFMNGIVSVAFGVIETVDTSALDVREKRKEIELELRATKVEMKVNYAFLALVNIQSLTANLVCCSPDESILAETIYGGKVVIFPANKSHSDRGGAELNLGNKVSRKKDYLPPLSAVLSDGWKPPVRLTRTYSDDPSENKKDEEDYGEVTMDCTEHGCQVRRKPRSLLQRVFHTAFAAITMSHFDHHHTHKSSNPQVHATTTTTTSSGDK